MDLNRTRAVLSTALFLCCLVFLGCQSHREELENLSKDSSLCEPLIIKTDYFSLYGYGNNKRTSHVNIYIEGDGQAWMDPWTISDDPTPSNPMGFRLATQDESDDSILYLGRPCQYIMDQRCTPLDWTSHRFGPKVLKTYQEALNQIKRDWKANSFTLHGYSGGATAALLLAGTRNDISSIITFAPLLDPIQWTNHHHYSSLSSSLSPLTYAQKLNKIPQDHFIGLNDTQVPYPLSKKYFQAVPPSKIVKVHLIPNLDHHSHWPEFWKSYILTRKYGK